MSQKIYVGNLPNNIGNEVLTEKFCKYGHVCSAKIIKDRETNLSMGFGFVEMESPEEAEKAIINLNGSFFNGHSISVVEAKKSLLH